MEGKFFNAGNVTRFGRRILADAPSSSRLVRPARSSDNCHVDADMSEDGRGVACATGQEAPLMA